MNKLSKTAKQFVTSHGIFILGRILFDIFMNLYIWKITNSISAVVLFNLIYIWAHLITFTALSHFAKKGQIQRFRIIGIIGTAILFLIIYQLGEKSASYLPILASIYGFFNAMYWLTYHILYFELTTTQNRGNFAGIEKSLRKLVNITAPLLGGFVVTINLFNLEYGNIFIIGAVLYIISAATGVIKIPKYELPRLHLLKTTKLILKNKDIRKAIFSLSLINIWSRGAMDKIIPIFIFHMIGSELKMGTWLSIFAATSIVATFVYGKYISYKYYKTATSISVGLILLSIISLLGFPIIITYIIFILIREITTPIIGMSVKVYADNMIEQIPDFLHHRVEYLVIKEWLVVGVARTISYSLLLFTVSLDIKEMKIFLIGMIIALSFIPILLSRIKTKLHHI